MSAPKKNQSLKCSQQVRGIPLERYRLPDDGRKWRQAARSRSALLVRLSSYANGDGTFVRDGRNYSPSLRTLLNHVGHGSYYKLTDELHASGLLSWTREKHYERRIYTIHLPESGPVFDQNQVQDSEIAGPTFDSRSPEQVQYSQITGPTSGNHPSLPSKAPSKEPSREREASAAEKPNQSLSHPSPSASEGRGSGQEKLNGGSATPDRVADVDVIAAAYGRLMDEKGTKATGWAKPMSRVHIEKLLSRFTRGEIIDALEYTFEGATEKNIPFIEKGFFADGGAAGIITRQRQKDWLYAIQRFINATDLDDLEDDNLDEFLCNEIPAGLESKSWMINEAKKNWTRLQTAVARDSQL
jgi:hypothetical protein